MRKKSNVSIYHTTSTRIYMYMYASVASLKRIKRESIYIHIYNEVSFFFPSPRLKRICNSHLGPRQPVLAY